MGDDPHLSEADTFTIQMEADPLLRSTIVAVALLDQTPHWGQLLDRVERATRLAPNFRRRLEPGRGPLAPPRWVADPDFDLSWHVRRVAAPEPANLDVVLELARVMGMGAFDPIRPRWEALVVEGLADGGAALILKLHHALTDGIGGIQLAHHLVDLERHVPPMGPLPDEPDSAPGGLVDQGMSAARFDLGRIGQVTGDLVRALPGAAASVARHPFRVWDDLGQLVLSGLRIAQPITRTLSPVMTERRLSWRYGALDVPLAELRAASHEASGTLNDAFLAAVAGGLAHYHRRHDSTVEELRVTMPISLRTSDDEPGGNHIGLVRVPVIVGDHDPVSRMVAIDRTCRTWRAERALPHSQLIAGALNLLPTAVTSSMLRHVDLLASNVPGFDLDVYLGGARMERFWVFGPPIGAAANVTLMSYRDQCCIGVNTDTAAVPDAESFLDCLRLGFDEVLAVADADHVPTRVVSIASAR